MSKQIVKLTFVLMLAAFMAIFAVGCSQPAEEPAAPQGEEQQSAPQGEGQSAQDTALLLATTTSTYDSGLLDVLEPDFEEQTGYDLRILSKGTGASLKLGKNGDVDVLLVHAKDRELAMVEEGYFINRHDVMYNDFIILGPQADPAGIKGTSDAAAAFSSIAAAQATFVSRGDDSGTNSKELGIWEQAGIEPVGDWYQAVGQGMGDTLRVTGEKQAYTLSDRATYLSMKGGLDLVVLVEGDEILFNQYGVMAVNAKKHETINAEGAQAFIDYLISPQTQEKIGAYQKYGEQLFVPNAD